MDFQEFPKMARLSRDIVITEKIDGTNAQIAIVELEGYSIPGALYESGGLAMFAGSRTRWITPEDDNYGFAKWAKEHAEELLLLGPGRHFGEWWGQGIQRNYSMTEKRFSMFNVARWALHGTEPKQTPTSDPNVFKTQDVLPPCCGLVPVLYEGPMEEFGVMKGVKAALHQLQTEGSAAAPGYMSPEGIVVFHTAANMGFKKTLEKDEVPKSKAK